MKYILSLSIVAAVLGGCAIVPAGYGDSRDGYYQERGGYSRGDVYYQERGYSSGDGNYGYRVYNRGNGYDRDYSYRRGYSNQGDPLREHDR
jgi:hypothetical protein